jgi:hypothetical protein
VVSQLAENYPSSDWAKVPKSLAQFGSGGINGTGAQCGNYMSAGLLFYHFGMGNPWTAAFLRWFETTPIPSNAAYIDYRSGTWNPVATNPSRTDGWGGTGMQIPLNNAPKVKSMTTTCHGAHTKWKVAASSWLKAQGSGANQDRCGKSTYDINYKIAQMINDFKAGAAAPSSADPVVAGCKTSNCHGSTTLDAGYPPTGVSGIITCQPCHSTLAAITPGHGF